MLDRLIVRNFKRFEEVEIELGTTVVLIGPNNSGKTSALQALALWELGVRRWHEKRGGKTPPSKRSGVAINRRDLVSLPVPDAKLLWRDLRTRQVERIKGKQSTKNIRIEIALTGVSNGSTWSFALEFDHANSESIHCRPVGAQRTAPIPPSALAVQIAYLPPMSGLTANEIRLDPGAVQVRLGEGRTAEVLRNLCYQLFMNESTEWDELAAMIRHLFGVDLEPPEYIPERGEIVMAYRDLGGARLDLSAAGRGLQQTLLLLSFLQVNPGAVVLLDEPDAHLEILRQRQIYQIVTELARDRGCQIISASHSEVLLNEAAGRDVVVAFVGTPHRIDDRGTQLVKSLRQIGFDAYYQAEQQGWVLYLEGSTDLAILRAFAKTLEHPAAKALERPFVCYIENQPPKAREHFFGLREAKTDLVGLAILDRLERPVDDRQPLAITWWRRREIESYLCFPEVLEAYAADLAAERAPGPLFGETERERLCAIMQECITDRIPPAAYRDRGDSWWSDVKASDDFLDPVLDQFFRKLELPNLMRKTDYHVLASKVPRALIDAEISEKLDLIVEVETSAQPE